MKNNVKPIISTTLVLLLIVGLFAAIPLMASAAEDEQTDPLEELIGVYKGLYTATQGLQGWTLDVHKNDADIVEAFFEFYPPAANPNVETGKALCSVSFDSNRNTYSVICVEWIVKPPTYVFANFLNGVLNTAEGKFTGDVYTTSGLIRKVGTFELYKEFIEIPEPETITITSINWNNGNGNGNDGGINQLTVDGVTLKSNKNYVEPTNFDTAIEKTILDINCITAIYTVTEKTVNNDNGIYEKVYGVKVALFEDGTWKVYEGQITVDNHGGNNKTQQAELLKIA
ncbi:MAG: hypothetical protein FWH37_09125 [Candidatus Bathyarchaeota archaeon]|nr:hypothetical protein [Candidatus Termiticorpusculum sp.]